MRSEKPVTRILVIGLVFLMIVGCTGGGGESKYTVSGMIADSDGKGIEDVALSFERFGTAVTDENGKWKKDGLSGTVDVIPAKEGWSFAPRIRAISEPDQKVDFVAKPSFLIQVAIDLADDGDTIVVPPGVYYENISFGGKSITRESEDPNDWDVVAQTILDGQQNGPVVVFKNSENSNAILRGFTITNGSGRAVEGTLCGGGIFVDSSSPTVSNNLIISNTASCGGGIYIRGESAQPLLADNLIEDNQGDGIYSISGAQPTISGNDIIGNTGLGIFCSQSYSILTDNTIANNSTGITLWYSGAATIAENEIRDNRFNGIFVYGPTALIEDNTIVRNGRGISVDYSSEVTITGNYIAHNDATGWQPSSEQVGGAIRLESASFQIFTIENNTLESNKATNGGGISFNGQTVEVNNNVIRNNDAENGAGIYAMGGSSLTLRENSFEENVAMYDGGGIYVSYTSALSELEGNFFRSNSPDDIYYE